MKALRVFLLGLLYGWLLKFLVDSIYWDDDLESILDENISLKRQIRSLETRLQSGAAGPKPPARAAIPPKPIPAGSGQDDLKIIKGIGPAIEKKLNEAGIQTFQALASLTVGELETILGSTKRLVKDAGNLIAQAQELAGQKG